MFNWVDASTDEMARHIAQISAQQVTSLMYYYKKKKNVQMLTKMIAARILAKRYRAAKKVESLIEEHGLQGVEYVAEPSKPTDAVDT